MLKRLLQLAFVVLIGFSMLGAGTPFTRADKLGHKLMCTCGCAEILLECNHVGCPDSPGLIAALHSQVDSGASDSAVFKFFATTYGPTVLASPIRGGFDNVAWIVPFAALTLGIVGVAILLRLWKNRHVALPSALSPMDSAELSDLRDRIRNETYYGE